MDNKKINDIKKYKGGVIMKKRKLNKKNLLLLILIIITIIESAYIIYKQVTKVRPIEQHPGYFVEYVEPANLPVEALKY